MQEYEKEEGISLGELFKLIFKRVWILVAVTLAVTVIAIVCVALFVNANKKEYRLEYAVEFPGYEDQRYPDGTAFRYQNLISLDTLNEIKASDEEFASVDTEKMADNNDISIVAETADVGGVRKPTGHYTVTVKASYFSSAETATAFLQKLANIPVEYIQAVAKNASYNFNLTAYASVSVYETKIDYLAEQRDYLADKYEELILKYGESYRYEGRSLSDYAAAAALQFGETAELTLRTDLELNAYVCDKEAYKASADLQKRALEREKAENVKILEALRAEADESAYLAGSEAFGEEIIEITARNTKIDTEIQTIETTLATLESQDSSKFDARLTSYYNNLKSATDTYHSVIEFIYDKEADVTFGTSKAVQQGGTSLILVAVGGLVGGFILACVIVCIIDLPKYFKAKKSETEPQEAEEDSKKE